MNLHAMLQKGAINKMNLEIEASKKRLFVLRQAQGSLATPERIVLTEAFHEVEATLEELRVVAEELRQQNEELNAAHLLVETERMRYRHLFDLAPHGYLLTDSEGIILESNRSASVMLNVEQKILRRKPMAVYFSAADKSAFYQGLNVLRDGGSRVDFEACLVPRGRDPFDANIVASNGPGGDAYGGLTFLWVIQDITERKRHAAKLAEFAEDLEQRVDERTAQLSVALEHQRRIAETLQHSLMPSLSADDSSLDLYGGYEAALDEAQVGGDFYDAFSFDGQAALIVGDVSGKGLTAAVYTSQVRFVLRAFLDQGLDPAHAMARLNDYIYSAQGRGEWNANTLVALSMIITSKSHREIKIFTAGIDPILVRASGEVEMVNNQGMILGVSQGFQYEPTISTLEPGDMALLATDGFAEARREGEFLGPEGVARFARQAAEEHRDIKDVGQAIQSRLREFAGGYLHDDICLLIARRT